MERGGDGGADGALPQARQAGGLVIEQDHPERSRSNERPATLVMPRMSDLTLPGRHQGGGVIQAGVKWLIAVGADSGGGKGCLFAEKDACRPQGQVAQHDQVKHVGWR